MGNENMYTPHSRLRHPTCTALPIALDTDIRRRDHLLHLAERFMDSGTATPSSVDKIRGATTLVR